MSDYRNGGKTGSKSFSGTGYDRWSYEQSAAGSNDTPLNKLQHKYWVAKQAVVRKLGKDEDEHIVASDAELDAKLDLFKSINETTSKLEALIEHYQDRLCNLAYEENCMGRFLKDSGKQDKTKAGKMMIAVGKAMSYSGQQRLAIRIPLVRLYQEVETFHDRAIDDTFRTIKLMEKIRTEYRGALMWMKNVSTELDPDTYKQVMNSLKKLEKFRKVQLHVKSSKSRFDKLKLDCLQKVDLLAASRCNMFSHALIMYQNALIQYWEKTAKTMNHVDQSFRGYQYYEFAYIKELAEPSRQLAQKVNQSEKDQKETLDEKEKCEVDAKDELFFFNPDYHDDAPEKGVDALELVKQSEQSLKNLLDLKEEADIDDENILLEIDSHLHSSKKKQDPTSLLESLHVDRNDEQLLADLMNDTPPTPGNPGTGFSDQWNKLFGEVDTSNQDDNLLDGAFTSGPTSLPPRASPANPQSHLPKKNMSDLLGMEQESSFNRQQKNDQKPFLPSQLFDLDQSLYSNQSSGISQDLSSFPMPSPAKPSFVDQQLTRVKQENDQKKVTATETKHKMSEWFSLFADLDPLANPDAIGITTKEQDPNCYS